MRSYFPAMIWLLIILIISGYPGEYVPKIPVWQFDKIVHSLMYLILSINLLIAFNQQYIKGNNRLQLNLKVIFLGTFYGGFMEILQNSIFINRSGNWYDFTANAVGAILGILAYPLILKILPINRWFKIK